MLLNIIKKFKEGTTLNIVGNIYLDDNYFIGFKKDILNYLLSVEMSYREFNLFCGEFNEDNLYSDYFLGKTKLFSLDEFIIVSYTQPLDYIDWVKLEAEIIEAD